MRCFGQFLCFFFPKGLLFLFHLHFNAPISQFHGSFYFTTTLFYYSSYFILSLSLSHLFLIKWIWLYLGYSYERLDGSVRGEERFTAIQNFNSTDDTFVFLLSSRAGGQGLNLTSADTVIFYDHDFNPQVSHQHSVNLWIAFTGVAGCDKWINWTIYDGIRCLLNAAVGYLTRWLIGRYSSCCKSSSHWAEASCQGHKIGG